MGLVEGIFGLKRDYAGLVIAPCFPPQWPKASITRSFRGTRYAIAFENPKGGSTRVASITVDGGKIEGRTLPLFADDHVHPVVVTLAP
jgi:cellobiose phosphorylase